MNAWRSPTGIRQAHPSNEVNDLSRQGRAALWMATLRAPVQPKSSSMPGDHHFRFDDQQSRSPLTPESLEPDPQEPVGGSQTHLVCGLSAEEPRADAEGQGSRLESQRECEILAEFEQSNERMIANIAFAKYRSCCASSTGSTRTKFLVWTPQIVFLGARDPLLQGFRSLHRREWSVNVRNVGCPAAPLVVHPTRSPTA